MKFGTKLIHNEFSKDKITGSLSIPIYQTSTFHQEDVEAGNEYEYSRSGNPTRKVLEETIADLEGGKYGFAFSSGMAAISSVLSIFSGGDHLIICEDVYGGTYRIASQFFSKFGVEVTFVDASSLDNIKSAIRPNTKGIYIESPSNPLMKITDIKGVVSIAKEGGLLTIIDNTFMTPYLQRPLDLGIDIVVHSATKFLGGHSDVIAGLVAVNDSDLAKRVYFVQNGYGAILGPQDSWLLLRGIRTLKVRLDFQQNSAQKMAEWFESHEKVDKVFYPGLDSHPDKKLHLSQATGSGAVFSVQFKDLNTTLDFLSKIKLGAVAVSLGGIETIASYPVKMSHASIPLVERERLGITDTLVRFSIGLEDTDDLINDFSQSL